MIHSIVAYHDAAGACILRWFCIGKCHAVRCNVSQPCTGAGSVGGPEEEQGAYHIDSTTPLPASIVAGILSCKPTALLHCQPYQLSVPAYVTVAAAMVVQLQGITVLLGHEAESLCVLCRGNPCVCLAATCGICRGTMSLVTWMTP